MYQPKREREQVVENEIRQVVEANPSWGQRKVYHALRRAGHRWNHKRVTRIYRQMGLHLRSKPKKPRVRRQSHPLTASPHPNECWSIDFMRDALTCGRAFRTFNVVDNFNRQALTIQVKTSLPSRTVTRLLDEVAQQHGYPQRLRLDNGTEFTAHHFKNWAQQHGIHLDFTEPGSPYQNAYIERFNRTFREDILDAHWFDSLDEAQTLANQWLNHYNQERPHETLGGLTPCEFRIKNDHSLLLIGSI